MQRLRTILASSLCAILVSACGGGGGGGTSAISSPSGAGGGQTASTGTGTTPANVDLGPLTLTPSALDLSTYPGESKSFSLKLTAPFVWGQPPQVGVFDRSGILVPTVSLGAQSSFAYQIGLKTVDNLELGAHAADLEVRVCVDDPRICEHPFSGSPWQVPLKVTAKDATASAARIVLTPVNNDVSRFSDEYVSVTFNIHARNDLAPGVTVQISDPSGYLKGVDGLTLLPDQGFAAGVELVRALPPGNYQTTLDVRFCLIRSGATCTREMAGSPMHMPVHIEIKSADLAAARVSPEPASVNLTFNDDETASFDFVMNARTSLNSDATISVTDPAGLLVAPDRASLYRLGKSQTIHVSVPTPLRAGTYKTALQVNMCYQGGLVCAVPVAGSPWSLPVTLNVKSTTNLTPLQALPNLEAWSTTQGNAAHTGHVAATFDPAKFTRRFQVPIGRDSSSYRFNRVATIDNGRVFVTNETELLAISEATGTVMWRVTPAGRLSSPASSNGKVYLSGAANPEMTMYTYSGSTGSLLNKAARPSQGSALAIPIVAGGNVYTQSGYYRGISGLDGNGNVMWSDEDATFSYIAAADGRYLYTLYKDSLYALDPASGAVVKKVPSPGFIASMTLSGTGMAYFVDPIGTLTGFTLATGTQTFSVDRAARGAVAYANGMIYTLNLDGSVLEARDGETGRVVWRTDSLVAPYGGLEFSSLVVSDNLAFVASDQSVLAIDLATHKVVWQQAFGGPLAISDRGVLYIVGYDTLRAINLR